MLNIILGDDIKFNFEKNFLINLYNNNGRNCAKVARLLNVNEKTIKKYLNQFGVDTSGHRHVDKYEFDRSYLLEQYKLFNYRSAKLARFLNVSEPTIKRHLTKHNIDSSINIGNRKHFFDESFFSVIDNEQKAYWLGFIIADGCIYRGSDKWSYRLHIALSIKDSNHLENFLKDLGADYTIEISYSNEHQNIKPSLISTIKINSTKLCKDLLALGVIPNKSMKETMPIIPDNLYRHLIRGYFDGDGCICNSKNRMLEWYFSILGGFQFSTDLSTKLPVVCNIHFKHKSTSGDILYNLVTSKTKNILLLYDYLYNNLTIFLDRKKDYFNKFTSMNE